MSEKVRAEVGGGHAPLGGSGSLEIRDTRTGKTYSAPIFEVEVEGDETIRGMDLRQIKVDPGDFGLMVYDPAFMNTASCKSAITFIDGDRGILRYRGYPIEQLAEGATFLEVAWLLRKGELPTKQEYDKWVHDISYHTYVHENVRTFMQGFRYDAHPMSMLCGTVAALSSFYPQASDIHNPEERNLSIIRLLAKVPTLAAFAYRHIKGLPFIYPDNRLSYVENFLSMVARMSEPKYEANPLFVKALEVLFILHADHEQNCSTNAVRAVGSSHVDPFSAVAAGIVALYGPLHGGANEQVLGMIEEINHPRNIPDFIAGVKGGKGQRLMGFGHRVYKSYDPRAKIVKQPGRRGLPGRRDRQGPGDRAGAGADRAVGRLLHFAQALPERRFLHRADLPLDGVPGRLLHRAFRRGPDGGLAGAVGRDAARQGTEDRAAPPDLHRAGRAELREQNQARRVEMTEDRAPGPGGPSRPAPSRAGTGPCASHRGGQRDGWGSPSAGPREFGGVNGGHADGVEDLLAGHPGVGPGDQVAALVAAEQEAEAAAGRLGAEAHVRGVEAVRRVGQPGGGAREVAPGREQARPDQRGARLGVGQSLAFEPARRRAPPGAGTAGGRPRSSPPRGRSGPGATTSRSG